jgi:hypothetical protein
LAVNERNYKYLRCCNEETIQLDQDGNGGGFFSYLGSDSLSLFMLVPLCS